MEPAAEPPASAQHRPGSDATNTLGTWDITDVEPEALDLGQQPR